MSDKKYIVRPGQKVTIEINRRKVPGPKSQVPSPKGMIKLRREDDFLPRRLQKKYLRLFDCGRDASGADIAFLAQPALPHDATAIRDLPDTAIALEHFAARDALLFALPGDTLFDKFHEITKETDAELYRLKFESDEGTEVLDESSDLWTDNGIKLPSDIVNGDNFIFPANPSGGKVYRRNFFNALAFESLKATLEYDYSAEAVEGFSLKAGDALFLMPSLCTYYGESDYFFDFQVVFLNYDYRFGLRNYYIGNLDPDIDPSEALDSNVIDGDYESVYQAAQFHINLDSARALHYEVDGGIWTVVAPEDFLPDPPFTETGASGTYTIEVRIERNNYLPAGVLLAVLVRGGQTFYLWQT